MIRAVFDTTLLASIATAGRVEKSGTIKRLSECWLLNEEVEVILSEYIYAELERVLQKKYFQARLTPEYVTQYLQEVRESSTIITLKSLLVGYAPHPKDDPIIATAYDGKAGYIVTGDKAFQRIHLDVRGIRVISPAGFLYELESMQQTKRVKLAA